MDKTILLGAIIAFVVSAVSAPMLIPMLRHLKFGQQILEIGPKWHSSKSGTPTMGGIIFILGITVATLIFLLKDFKTAMLLYLSLSFGLVGFLDDYIKVANKRNLGLTELQKLFLQIVAAVIFVTILYYNGGLNTNIIIPFMDMMWDIGILYLPLSILVIIAVVNAVNLTDGVDGLASCVSIVICTFFCIVTYLLGDKGSSVFSASVVGGTLGFLIYNKYPARVFMGDTGALFLGGAIAGISVLTGLQLIIIIAGGVFLIETLSVIIQVSSMKLTGKRVFKMAPIHHHFEMLGWSENKIVIVFSVATAILCVISYFAIGIVLQVQM